MMFAFAVTTLGFLIIRIGSSEGQNVKTCNGDMQKYMEDAIKYEYQKYREENEETNYHEIYDQDEVLPPTILDAVIKDELTKVYDSYHKNLQEKIENLIERIGLKENEDGQTSEAASEESENIFLEKLQNLERVLQEKDTESGAKYYENIVHILSSTASKIKELYSFPVKYQTCLSLPRMTNEDVIRVSAELQNPQLTAKKNQLGTIRPKKITREFFKRHHHWKQIKRGS